MPNLLLIDTDILIDVGRDDKKAVARLQKEEIQFEFGISVITKMELLVGCRNKNELKKLDDFLERFKVLSIEENIADRAVELLRIYRLSHGLLIPDSLIAATALELNVSLLSKNQKDYRFISELNLLPFP